MRVAWSAIGGSNRQPTAQESKERENMLTFVAIAVTSAALGGQPYEIGGLNARDALLVTPRPYPAYRVDSPDRLENQRDTRGRVRAH